VVKPYHVAALINGHSHGVSDRRELIHEGGPNGGNIEHQLVRIRFWLRYRN
jgi:hypothetical protein